MDSDAGARYPNVSRAVFDTPWPVLSSTLETIAEIVSSRAHGQRLSEEEIRARIGLEASSRSARSASVVGTVAVVPLQGVIFPQANLFTQYSGGTALSDFAADLRDAVANEQVAAILIDVNSPGGSADMLTETAAVMRELRGTKPIAAVANPLCASAALWLASQCDEISATPSAMYGSQGVVAVHTDFSAQLAATGIKPTIVKAGRYKAEFNSLEPLGEEAHARLQAVVDDMNDMFVADVAAGRGISAQTVRDNYGQGRMFTPTEALAAGMIDRIETYDQALTRLAKGGGKASKPGRKAAAEIVSSSAGAPAQVEERIAAILAEAGFPDADHSDRHEAEATHASSDERVVLEKSLALDEQPL